MKTRYFCPACKQQLREQSDELRCEKCARAHEIRMSIPLLLSLNNLSNKTDWVDIARSATGYEFDSSSTIKYPEFLTCLNERYQRALDLGCSGGAASSIIATISDEIYGVDLSFKGLLVFGERKISNSFPINASAYELPFPDNYFDLIVSMAVIEHLEYPAQMIEEARRVIKPAGHFVVRDDAWMHGMLERLRLLPGRIGGPRDPTHISMMTPRCLRDLLINNGFPILKHWYLPLAKFSSRLNIGALSPLAIKGQFLCTTA